MGAKPALFEWGLEAKTQREMFHYENHGSPGDLQTSAE